VRSPINIQLEDACTIGRHCLEGAVTSHVRLASFNVVIKPTGPDIETERPHLFGESHNKGSRLTR